ncbi:MAG: PQQ-binding-like beta-propeller repeat protein [Lentisphaerota bacterium]|jgi:outer membrane protein assembly factor BamB
MVMALQRGDGGVVWQKTMIEQAPQAGTHADGSWASGSPITDGELLYVYFGSYGLYALTLDGEQKWSKSLGTFKTKANFGEGVSPVLSGGWLYYTKSNDGFLTCVDAATGQVQYGNKLEGTPAVFASPIAAGGRLYVPGKNGLTTVLKLGPKFDVLATNKVDEVIIASPAAVGNSIFLRGDKSLYCIEGQPATGGVAPATK